MVPARGSVCACSAVVFAYCATQASTAARVLRRSGELVSSHTDLFTWTPDLVACRSPSLAVCHGPLSIGIPTYTRDVIIRVSAGELT